MAKYNIKEPKVKDAAYRSMIKPEMADVLKKEIYDVIVKRKKYLDHSYTAKQLASDISTNTRYISAVVNVKFGMNYSNFVNKYRVEDAMKVLASKEFRNLTMDEVSMMVGFANRQSFYSAFYRLKRMTPRQYREQMLSTTSSAK
ncbi:MAG: helix-turn-helix domain-containing protein [Prevotella sp.]